MEGMTCTYCGKKHNTNCPLPTYSCACKGDYCRLLGFDPTRFCSTKCRDAALAKEKK